MAAVFRPVETPDVSLIVEWTRNWLCDMGARPPRPPVPPIVPGVVFLWPNQATLTSQSLIVAYGGLHYDGVTENLSSMSLPVGWTDTISGGASVRPTLDGIVLSTGYVPGSARVTIPSISGTRFYFDIAVDITVSSLGTTRTEPVSLEYANGIDTARVVLLYDPSLNPVSPFALFEGTASGDSITGGAAQPNSLSYSLRMIRQGEHVWGFIGSRDTERLDQWISLTPLGRFDIHDDGTGDVFVRTSNLVGPGITRVTIKNFTSRGHLTINGRLVDNKEVVEPTRVLFNLPVGGSFDLGSADVIAFGEGVGVDDVADGTFTYLRPEPYSIGGGLRLYTDPTIRDNR